MFARASHDPRHVYLLADEDGLPPDFFVAEQLVESALLSDAETMTLELDEPPDETMEALSNTPALARLTTLYLADMYVEDEHMRALTSGAGLPALRQLHLQGLECDVGTFATLFDAPWCARLSALAVSGHDAGDAIVARLITTPHLRGVTQLRLEGLSLTDEGAAALARWTGGTLSALHLSDNEECGDAAIAALLAAPCLAHLTALGISNTRAASKTITGALDHLPALESLNLDFCTVTDASRAALHDAGFTERPSGVFRRAR